MRAADRILSGVRPATMREELAALLAADDLDRPTDHYGDGVVAELEEQVAGLLGMAAAVFFPTGTMAQQVALRHGAELTGCDAVAVHPLGHQELHERDAYAQLTGLRGIRPTTEPRNPRAEEIIALGEPVGTVVLELPMRDAGFVLPSWDELVAVSAAAREAGARVHFDGARLWESTPHLGHSLAEIAGVADSVYVSFYKSLGGLSGCVLAGTARLGEYARAWRHRYGGLVFQQWPAALAAQRGLRTVLPRLPEYVRHARTVAAAMQTLPGARVFPSPPHTQAFRLWLPHPAEALNEAALALAEEEGLWFAAGWTDADVPGLAMAEIRTAEDALAWTADDVVAVGTRLLARLPS